MKGVGFILIDGAEPLRMSCKQLGDVPVCVGTLFGCREVLKHEVRSATQFRPRDFRISEFGIRIGLSDFVLVEIDRHRF